MPGFVTDHVTGKSGRIDVENVLKYGAWIIVLYSIYQPNIYMLMYVYIYILISYIYTYIYIFWGGVYLEIRSKWEDS